MIKKIKLWLLQFKTPNNTLYLKVDKDHELYIEEYGNPNGETFIFLHGGPGGDFDSSNLRWFNLKTQRVILFEQRACNRSKGDFYKNNTTWDMVEDIEKIRTHFKLEKFNIFGGSWGTCLALAYSIKYPSRVNKLFLWGLLLGNKADVDYIPSEFLSPEEKHFCDNGFFFAYDDWILRNCKVLQDKEIYLAHGKNDIVCSYKNSLKLKECLNNINLHLEEEGTHSSSSPGIENFLKEII